MNDIRQMTMTLLDADGNATTYEGEQAWFMVEQRRPYNGVPYPKPLPQTNKNYRAKNPAGGTKCTFSTPPQYKRRHSMMRYQFGIENKKRYEWPSGVSRIARPWYGWEDRLDE